MKGASVIRLGGMCSILIGVVSFLVGLTYLLLPAEQKLGMRAPDLLPSFAQNPTLLTLQSIELAVVGLLGLALVPAVYQLLESVDEGWMRWMSALAYLGYGVMAVSNLLVAGRLPGIAAAFVAGDASTKSALAPVWRSTLDWQAWWQQGAVGAWILVSSLLALRNNALPRSLALLGIVAAVVQVLVPIAFVFKIPSFITVIAAIGGIVETVWYIWLGLALRRQFSPQLQPRPGGAM
ncbi:MAG TPA: DUF4386 family protein [Anaerolineae bacterium]